MNDTFQLTEDIVSTSKELVHGTTYGPMDGVASRYRIWFSQSGSTLSLIHQFDPHQQRSGPSNISATCQILREAPDIVYGHLPVVSHLCGLAGMRSRTRRVKDLSNVFTRDIVSSNGRQHFGGIVDFGDVPWYPD